MHCLQQWVCVTSLIHKIRNDNRDHFFFQNWVFTVISWKPKAKKKYYTLFDILNICQALHLGKKIMLLKSFHITFKWYISEIRLPFVSRMAAFNWSSFGLQMINFRYYIEYRKEKRPARKENGDTCLCTNLKLIKPWCIILRPMYMSPSPFPFSVILLLCGIWCTNCV